jgi:flagellar biosynthesis protein FlhB
MAEEEFQQEKTLEPTERRLQKAREEGQFAQSRDLTTLVLLVTFMVFILAVGPLLAQRMILLLKQGLTFSNPERWMDHVAGWVGDALLGFVGILMLLLVPVLIVAIIAPLSLASFRPVFVLRFDASRMNPIKGFGRIFSLSTAAELVKTILKAFLVLGIGMAYLYLLLGNVITLVRQDFNMAVANTTQLVFNGAVLLLVPLVLIALADALFQRFNFMRQMRMSREEIKQEMKEMEGSPELRAKLRQRQRAIAQSRMMAAIERADVVIVNPDHYSIAIRYDEATMVAPVVVAKGTDEIALRIQEVAREHSVPIARIPPLARLMVRRLEIGEQVPEQLFEAVAKVLAWAYELKRGTKELWDLPEISGLEALEKTEQQTSPA